LKLELPEEPLWGKAAGGREGRFIDAGYGKRERKVHKKGRKRKRGVRKGSRVIKGYKKGSSTTPGLWGGGT